MSSEATPVTSAVLVTIITESVLKDSIIKLLKQQGVNGYTLTEVQGEGGHGKRMGDIPGYNTNIEIKTIVSLEISDDIFRALAGNQGNRALTVFRNNVEALIS
jgi:nitrogen regulatory protein PII